MQFVLANKFLVNFMRMTIDLHDKRLGDVIIHNPRDPVDIGIIGAPFDGSTRGRPGARFAPRCIRESLYSMTTFVNDVDLENIRIGDFGDIETSFSSVERNKEEIYSAVREALRKCKRIIVIGGDHSITEPAFKAFSESRESVGLIVFDAHLDLRDLKAGTVSSGTVMEDILKNLGNKIKPANLVYIGIRDFVNPKYYVEKARRLGVKIYKAQDILYSTPETFSALLEDAISRASDGTNGVYISFDADVIDCSFAPGLNAPSPLGLRPEHVVQALTFFGSKDVGALDITEVSPPYDPTGNTCKIVSACIIGFIASSAKVLMETPHKVTRTDQ